MRPDNRVLAAVCVGGALGAATRYGFGVAFPDHPGRFPWTTFIINVTGCLTIGVLIAALALLTAPHRLARPLLGTGFLGGYTTFSTYADQTRALVQTGRWLLAAAYVVSTLLAALGAVYLGVLGVRLTADRRTLP